VDMEEEKEAARERYRVAQGLERRGSSRTKKREETSRMARERLGDGTSAKSLATWMQLFDLAGITTHSRGEPRIAWAPDLVGIRRTVVIGNPSIMPWY
jgi:hypothetical protein